MKLDPVLKVTLAMHSSPGVYALLLGSGVSTAVGIPTGWDVTLDLIKRLAVAQRKKPEPDPETWYAKEFGEEPDYSRLLDQLTKTQTERSNLLRSYFEPTEEEREQGLKVPTEAHKAIANLVSLGYVRLILTTNFDRLMEQTLETVGIQPDVIASSYALKGAVPLIHSRCTVVKLHGDYRDTRIKNTPRELARYAKGMDAFLDQVLDEFGLIFCGWSGNWDRALRKAILRCPNRRFATYWLARGDPNDEAQEVIRHRQAEVISIESADVFFTDLGEKIESLRDLDRPHPLSTATAVQTVKRYVADPSHRIRLHDLIHEETEEAYSFITNERFSVHEKPTKEIFQERLRHYEVATERLMHMLAALSYHDGGNNTSILTRTMERLLSMSEGNGYTLWINLWFYPAVLILYAAGIVALAGQRYYSLAALLAAPTYWDRSRDTKRPGIRRAHIISIFNDADKWLPIEDAERKYTPGSDYIFNLLHPLMRDYLPDEKKYETTFDLFEYLVALVYIDLTQRDWAPTGSFAWRQGRYDGWDETPLAEFVRTGLEQGADWPPLKAGLFGGIPDQLKEVVDTHRQFLDRVRRGKGWI